VIKHLLRTEQIAKLKFEYELWCPICESSAVMPRNTSSLAPFLNAKCDMQQSRLGFIPADRITLEQVLATTNKGGALTAAGVLQGLATSMHHMYETEIRPSHDFYISREKVRAQVETLVTNQCQAHFPEGTRVLVFGSSANGFGSSSSDLDMCLQLPNTSELEGWFETKGREAMAFLAEALDTNGMDEVNSERLTARIPVLMFRCPIQVAADDDSSGSDDDSNDNNNEAKGKTIMLECDISMRNPLAVLNTQFLRSYALLDTRIPVLASMIKKWAKARNVNDPSKRTLSSYGYLLMLLHFLLLRRQEGMCLPNLLYTDPNWKSGEVYHESPTRPELSNCVMQHPNEDDYNVNAYFYSPRDEKTFRCLQRIVTSGGAAGRSNNTSCEVGLLLAKFFRYYAFEFDYKQHIISLHSGGQRSGYVKKERKGEMDGWKAGNTASLAIEDPFEQFYNVGHVVNPIQFQRIRKEFALAYTKIVSACLTGEGGGRKITSGEDLIALLCEPEEQPGVHHQ
jgi:DNA polymerase sigma